MGSLAFIFYAGPQCETMPGRFTTGRAFHMMDHPVTLQRILVVGTTGSGKTTLAGQIAERLGYPHIEQDALTGGQSGPCGQMTFSLTW